MRITGKELCEDQEFTNACKLYQRCAGLFKNVSRAQRDTLSEHEFSVHRLEIIGILEVNAAQCFFRRSLFKDCLKHCQEALSLKHNEVKAHFWMYKAYAQLKDLDNAKASLEAAIKLVPGDRSLRQEHQTFCKQKQQKEREWESKMSGFFGTHKMQKIEENDDNEAQLRRKVERQVLGQCDPNLASKL